MGKSKTAIGGFGRSRAAKADKRFGAGFDTAAVCCAACGRRVVGARVSQGRAQVYDGAGRAEPVEGVRPFSAADADDGGAVGAQDVGGQNVDAAVVAGDGAHVAPACAAVS